MLQPALVAYATVYGSTHEIAERLAARLRARGIATDCRPAADSRESCTRTVVPQPAGSWLLRQS
jgi:menaquinone-dependent protoporphyrinogen IX oxidase